MTLSHMYFNTGIFYRTKCTLLFLQFHLFTTMARMGTYGYGDQIQLHAAATRHLVCTFMETLPLRCESVRWCQQLEDQEWWIKGEHDGTGMIITVLLVSAKRSQHPLPFFMSALSRRIITVSRRFKQELQQELRSSRSPSLNELRYSVRSFKAFAQSKNEP